MLAFLLVALLGVGPNWWERKLYRDNQALAGVGATLHPGGLTSARRKIDPGNRSDLILRRLGAPSMASAAQGLSRHEVWTYYYSDGTMVCNLTDGIAQRITLSYGAPSIPTARESR
ncbi:MAG: hypothetical protein LC796_10925 [Acidobacteria bacterium]|nr:hypothetical protein [Acidobacteriota bacterium]MCA1610906.1 hypothetical protein [Acidobacteriota bacterium]MCA1617335.1 hypothetical protein [Acidobacteriota bacterium]